MHVVRLTLTDFRNHERTELVPGPPLVVLTGPNGAGKTNILEALSLLAPGRGLRGAAMEDMLRDGATAGFAIVADCRAPDAPDLAVTIGTGTVASAPSRRRVRINGADTPASALGEWVSMIWLTPAMDRLFVEAASQRRRFLDRMTLALVPDHARHAARYDAAMRARSRLLAQDAPADPAWLAALEAQMADHGAALDAARHALVRALAAEAAEAPVGVFARPGLSLVSADGQLANPWDLSLLAAALAAGRGRDARAGRALVGPHRNDLAVTHLSSGQPADRCSTGEQKALLLSIILAHGDMIARERGQRPILLLDELAAHLDPDRRAALFDRLVSAGGQVWMTGTEPQLFSAIAAPASRFRVDNGHLSAA